MSVPNVNVRHLLYTVTAAAAVIVPALVSVHILDPKVGEAVLAVLALLGGGTASAVLSAQKSNNALVFSGPVADQAIAAAQATAEQAANAAADLARVKDAVAAAAGEGPVLGPLAQQAIDAIQ